MPSKVAIYIRVSTQEQAQEGYSITAQTERLTAYCKAKDWTIADVYTDPGFSGSNMQRPALQRLLDDARAGAVDCVLVYKLDRLSRSQKDTLTIIEDILLKNDVAFVSMSENFDTSSPLGRAMIGILSVFAQLEREQIRERMSLGRAERARAGLWHGGGWRPFGYDYVDGRLVVNELEAVAVREVYALFLSGTPITSILNVLQRKYGMKERNHSSVVSSILSTKLYLGEIVWQGQTFKGQHEAIIDEVTFKRAAVLLRSRARIAASKPNPFKSTSLFGSLLRCGNCGAGYFLKGNYSGRNEHRVYRPYYTCYSRGKTRRERIVDPTCLNHSYPEVVLDGLMMDELDRLIEHPHLVDEIAAKPKKEEESNLGKRREAILRRLDEIDNQLSRVVDLYQLGSISIQEIGERSKKLQNEKSALKATYDGLTDPDEQEKLSPDEARKHLVELHVADTLEDKQRLLRLVIRRIVVLPQKINLISSGTSRQKISPRNNPRGFLLSLIFNYLCLL